MEKYLVSVLYEDTFTELFIKAVFWTSSFEEIKPKLVQTVDQVEKEIEEKLLLEEAEKKEALIINVFRLLPNGEAEVVDHNFVVDFVAERGGFKYSIKEN